MKLAKIPKLLLIDDDTAQITFFQAALRNEAYGIETAFSAEEAFSKLAETPPDLIILDLGLPGTDGYGILRIVRKEPRYDTIPIIVFSAHDDPDAKIKGLDMGAVEFLVKPIHPQELAARIRALLRLKDRQDKIIAEYQRLSELSLTDPLTGAYNRRALNTFLKSRFAESARHNIPVSCVMFDLDHFKNVNDSYGHDTGDLVLQEVSALTMALFRREDALIRYGGEEFLAILFHTPREGARTFAERLRSEVATRIFNEETQPVQITLSAGIASNPDDAIEEPEGMITLADQRLYAAKRAGRNRVIFEGK